MTKGGSAEDCSQYYCDKVGELGSRGCQAAQPVTTQASLGRGALGAIQVRWTKGKHLLTAPESEK